MMIPQQRVRPVARRIETALMALLLVAAAPPDAAPGFDTGGTSMPAFAQPRRDAPLDPTLARLVVNRLVQLHLLDNAADAQDPAKAADAIRGFQIGVGLKSTGVLDRKTLAFFAL
jgi:hypothetical protein